MNALPGCLFPLLVEKVFEKYAKIFASKEAIDDACKQQFFVELHHFFGDVLTQALELLDRNTSVTIYRGERHHREIAVIKIRKFSSLQLVRLFPGINYCNCDYFQTCVLGVSSTEAVVPAEAKYNRYTCAHVILLRLAQSLKLKPPLLIIEECSEDKFKELQKPLQRAGSNQD